ncbi:MAG: hypothetical protein MR902_07115 [Campylobacter sp.]|nr:hypothetical protein [Campylobacter sp.]
MYTNYIFSRSVDKLESQSQILLDQISNLFADRVRATAIARGPGVSNVTLDETTDRHRTLEWIGIYEYTRFNQPAPSVAGWSGILPNHTTEVALSKSVATPGSNFNSYKSTDFNNVAIIFDSAVSRVGSWGYDKSGIVSDVGKVTIDKDSTTPITFTTLPTNTSSIYYMVQTAYTIAPGLVDETTGHFTEGGIRADGTFDLVLFYDYRPWDNEEYTDYFNTNTNHQILANNVTMFRFRGNYGSVDMKICVKDPELEGVKDSRFDFRVCKAKVIL